MFSLFLLGSGSIKYFSLALVVGISAGTYSSIFIASPIVLFLKKVRK
jgi:preprotein translocase subunit SecF